MDRIPMAESIGIGWRLQTESGGGMNRNRVAACAGIRIIERKRAREVRFDMITYPLLRFWRYMKNKQTGIATEKLIIPPEVGKIDVFVVA